MPRFLILSDLHLGVHKGVHHVGVGLQAASVIQRARLDNTADVIVLNGDIFDNWAHPIDAVPPSWEEILAPPEIQAFMAEISQWPRGNVWYLRGNHDFDIPDLPNVTMYTGFGTAYKELWFEHGHRMDLFNAPDLKGRPYPFGYFITRVHTQGLHKKAPSLDPNIHKYTNAVSPAFLAESEALQELTLPKMILSVVALDAGVPMTAKIHMPDGSTPTLEEVANDYGYLLADWAQAYGFEYAANAALVSAEQMEWEAQAILKGAHKRVLVLGHSHKPEYHYYGSFGGYVNDGAMCNSNPTWTRITYPDTGTDAVCIEQYRLSETDKPVSTTWVKV